ncbi:hypothetical protein PanWU01x14_083660, partial [Parasponia andersonii]
SDQQRGDYAKDVLELDTWKVMNKIPKIPLRTAHILTPEAPHSISNTLEKLGKASKGV